MDPELRRRALRAVLRHKRSLIPRAFYSDQLGKPLFVSEDRSGPGRTPSATLTQADMDVLTGKGRNTYNRLEGGRLLDPPEEYLRHVAQVLGLNGSEFAGVYLFSSSRPPYRPLRPEAGLSVAGGWQAIVDSMGMVAYIHDRGFNNIFGNQHFRALYKGDPPKNNPEWMLFSEEARSQTLVQWERWARSVIAGIMGKAAAHPEDETLAELILRIMDDEWTAPLVEQAMSFAHPTPDGDWHRMRHPTQGEGVLLTHVADIPDSPGARMVVGAFYADEPPASMRRRFHSPFGILAGTDGAYTMPSQEPDSFICKGTIRRT